MLRKKIVLFAFLLLNSPQIAHGAAQVSVGGYASTNHRSLATEEKSALSASLAFDIFSMVQLGYTLRTSNESTFGTFFEESYPTADQYVPYELSLNVVKQSIDVTLVPFMARTLVPFIFVGVAQQSYVRRQTIDLPDGTRSEKRESSRPGEGYNPLFSPNGGIGVKIPLSADFSIKVTQTWTKGVTQQPGEEEQEAIDSYTEFSISYNL